MEKKTCFVKEDSIQLFKSNLSDSKTKGESDLSKRIRELTESLSGEKSWSLPTEFIYPKHLLSDYEEVVFEVADKAELTKIEFTSTFTYSIEPYDDISVKLVLQSTDSVRK